MPKFSARIELSRRRQRPRMSAQGREYRQNGNVWQERGADSTVFLRVS